MAERILELALDGLREKGLADAAALSSLAVAGKADGTYLIAHEAEIPTWRPRSYNTEETPVGKPYRWQGQVYQLWQAHDASGQGNWSPDAAVALWDLCHTREPRLAKPWRPPQGSRGLWRAEECCTWGGRVWKCLTDSTAYSPEEVPDSWQDLGPAAELPA